jgi:hypothetical protein
VNSHAFKSFIWALCDFCLRATDRLAVLSSVSRRGVWETKAVEEFVNRTSARVSVVRGDLVQSGSVKMADERVRKMKVDIFRITTVWLP